MTSAGLHALLSVSFRLLGGAVAAAAISAHATTVEWNEEVPLNTGQTIWVKRSVEYVLRGGAGNPLDIKVRPASNQYIRFEYAGKTYEYDGDARLRLLAVAPDGTPALVASAGDNAWASVHKYECTVPFYVQLIPGPDHRTWAWPPRIEPWLIGLKANLMLSRLDVHEMKSRYTAEDRARLDRNALARSPGQGRIDGNHRGNYCRETEQARQTS